MVDLQQMLNCLLLDASAGAREKRPLAPG